MARVVGARPDEIGLMNSLTVNIHLLLTSFFRPAGRRRAILTDGPLFPSDRHALTSHIAARGLDPSVDLIVVEPRTGESTLRIEDLEAAIADHADELALVFLAGVNFATGQALEIGRLTAAGHEAGAVVGWDLAHAAGNIELALHDDDVDFAAWCTYKYLNGGPGAVASIFVHERHGRDPSIPRLGGWWGSDPGDRFEMEPRFVPAPGAAGWSVSTTPILALAPIAASLAIVDEVGMPALRARSVALTGYLADLLDDLPVEVITPSDPAARGAQLSLRFRDARVDARDTGPQRRRRRRTLARHHPGRPGPALQHVPRRVAAGRRPAPDAPWRRRTLRRLMLDLSRSRDPLSRLCQWTAYPCRSARSGGP